MNLALDIGNSHTKIALFDKNELVSIKKTSVLNVEELEILFAKHTINNAIISTVKILNDDIVGYLKQKSSLITLTEQTPIPVKNLYLSPETLGRDRLAVAVAGAAKYPKQNVLTIDIGTCINYDFVNDKNEYLGGAISPGIDIRLKSLNAFTGKLPLVEKEPVNYFIGRSTKESILSGVINGITTELNDTIASYKSQFPELMVLTTGGDSSFFETRIKTTIFAVPNLVLEGLNKIIQHNAS